ncbi:hypothetical protein SAY86_010190 [Trapa natans]|uniref:PB1 domain-containing protein n=1 Tax=Trapa natans TaxID=22666 RepID=A0AAN7L582_TRANT|nr:hypothetical protein SAY86_010190 [Trapa natans]
MVREVSNRSGTIKFLCSYGGQIVPRRSDGKLRYLGGFTRILAVPRAVSYAELMVKVVEFCGFSVILRCQLPDGDLETLVSIKSDEDLASIIEEYDRASLNQKIRAVLSPVELLKQVSPPLSNASSVGYSIYKSPSCYTVTGLFNSGRYGRRSSSPPHGIPLGFNGQAAKLRCAHRRYYAYGEPRISCSAAPCCCNYPARLPETEVQRTN